MTVPAPAKISSKVSIEAANKRREDDDGDDDIYMDETTTEEEESDEEDNECLADESEGGYDFYGPPKVIMFSGTTLYWK